MRLDPPTRQAWRDRTEIQLSAKEFALLETLMRRPGQVLSRYQLLEYAWDYAVRPGSIDLSRDDESVAEVLDPDAVPESAADLGGRSEARHRGRVRSQSWVPSPLEREPARYLVSSVRRSGDPLVLVVGVSLEDRQETLDELLAQLLVAAPLGLLFSTLAGYGLAGGGATTGRGNATTRGRSRERRLRAAPAASRSRTRSGSSGRR